MGNKEIPKPPPDWASPQEIHNWEDRLAEWSDRERWNEEWNKQKELNHQSNINILHGVVYKGVYYHNGNGQKRQ